MRPFESGNKKQRLRRRGKTSKPLFQQSTWEKISRTNSRQRTSKQTWSRSKPKQSKELIAMLTEKHTQQMETLIKSTTKAMKEMMPLIKNEKTNLVVSWKSKRKRSEQKHAKSATMHLFARTAERNTQPKWRTIVGSSKKKRFPPIQLEDHKEHLNVRGAHRIWDVATRKSDIE